jgi:hypothetical protein
MMERQWQITNTTDMMMMLCDDIRGTTSGIALNVC